MIPSQIETGAPADPTATATPIAAVQGVRSVNLAAPRMSGAVGLAEALGLHPSEADGQVLLIGSDPWPWASVSKGPVPALLGLEFNVADPSTLEAIAARLDYERIPFERGDDGTTQMIRLADPEGTPISVVLARPSASDSWARGAANFTDLLHAVLYADDIESGVAFYESALGLRVTDWIERSVVFMRVPNGYHHAVALVQRPVAASPGSRLAHICIRCRSLDDLMIVRRRVLESELPITTDLVRHLPDNALSFYVVDAGLGLTVELTWDVIRVPDEGHHIVRTFPNIDSVRDVWGSRQKWQAK